MLSPQLFCATCGAANSAQATECFACGERLQRLISIHTSPIHPLLKQRYRLLNRLGQGGMGSVYKAEDTELGNRLVAIKELSQKGLNQQESNEATEGFKREALLLAGIMHPNLPRIYDHFAEAGRWYLVMDFIDGETLEDYLIQRGNQLPLPEVLEIGIQLCTVLNYLHTRQPPIIFRDLKPSNVMRTPDGQLYLIDFGIARHFKPGQVRDTIAFGSPGYAAPEQYGKAQTSSAADIYSLGAMLHQMITGHDPSTTPFVFHPLLQGPLQLQKLLNQMLDLDINKRLSDAAMAKQFLQSITNQEQTSKSYSITVPAARASASKTAIPPTSLSQPSSLSSSQVIQHMFSATTSSRLGTSVCTYSRHSDIVTAIAWSPDGLRIASASYDKTVQIWDATNGQLQVLYERHIKKWKNNHVNSIAWSPDGNLLASSSDDRTIHIWDSASGQTRLIYNKHTAMIFSLAWSPDGKFIASGGGNLLHLWDMATGKALATYEELTPSIQTITWSLDGDYLAIGRQNGIAQVLDTTNQQLKVKLIYNGHTAGIEKIAWSPVGTHIASGSSDKTVQIWSALSGKRLLTYLGHSGAVRALAWSPDGKQIVSASGDGKMQIWDTQSKQTIFVHPGYSTATYDIAWSPDGSQIASGAHNMVQVWQAK